MIVAFLGDTHLGYKNDSLIMHEYFEKFYTNVFFPYLKEHNIQRVFQFGDLFDRRKYINFLTLYQSRKYFFDRLKKYGIDFHTLLGNHDIYFKNTLEVNSPQTLLREYDNITIYDDFNTINWAGVDIDIVPWIHSGNFEDIMNKIRESKSKLLFGHLEIMGFDMDIGNPARSGFDKKLFNKYDKVFSGHFHHRSDDGHIYYVGAPAQHTWADLNDIKGFHTYNLFTNELKFIPNPYTLYHTFLYDDRVLNDSFVKEFPYQDYKKVYLKILVKHKSNPYLFDKFIGELSKSELVDLSISEDYSLSSIQEDYDVNVENTPELLKNCIKGMDLGAMNKEKLYNKLHEIYIEANSREQI